MEVDTVNDQKIIQKICFSKLAKLSFLYIRRYFNTMLNLKLHIWSKIRLFETETSKGGDFCACREVRWLLAPLKWGISVFKLTAISHKGYARWYKARREKEIVLN